MLLAQAAAEYGAVSVIGSAVQSLVYRVQSVVTDRGDTLLLAAAAGVVVWWLFFRSK